MNITTGETCRGLVGDLCPNPQVWPAEAPFPQLPSRIHTWLPLSFLPQGFLLDPGRPPPLQHDRYSQGPHPKLPLPSQQVSVARKGRVGKRCCFSFCLNSQGAEGKPAGWAWAATLLALRGAGGSWPCCQSSSEPCAS